MGQPHDWTQIIIRWFPFVLLFGVWVFFLLRNRARNGANDQPQTKLSIIRIIGVSIGVFALAAYTIQALTVPWTWTGAQIVITALCMFFCYAAVMWMRVWWVGGRPAVKAQCATSKAALSGSTDISITWKGVLFWVVIAVALVFVFNLFQQHGVR